LAGVFVLIRKKQGLSQAIPFGPYLGFGALLYIFFGKEISLWYIGVFMPALGPVN
jgi:prepilin signal peptidase PulO-like enzyme (type II secretory pathway)